MKNFKDHFKYVKATDTIELDDVLSRLVCTIAPRRGSVQKYVLALEPLKNQLGDHDTFAPFINFISKRKSAITADFNKRAAAGIVIFDDLPLMFQENTEIVVENAEFGAYGARVKASRIVYSFLGEYLDVQCEVVSVYGGALKQKEVRIRVYYFEGGKKVSTLPCRPITPEEKARLTEGGRKFRDLVKKPAHMVCTANLMIDRGWYGIQKYRNHGRVMIDARAMKQADPNYFNGGYDPEEEEALQEIPDENLWMCESRVFGFSFSLKKWGEMAVRDLVPINYRHDAYDKLVLDEKAKKAVLALVDRAHVGFSDIIDGKGGGCIFLLHGAPGLGKTMTAEAVADYLGRPLYSVSAGELGVEPGELEESLRKILDIAATWNAVILLDEADVYLEQRDERDIVRNAMVGVFLRMLEYHSGVMFLTTNRVRNFDQAFFSRISMIMHYPDMTIAARAKVWGNLLEAAGAQGIEVCRLAEKELNGRQIKNVIRAAQALAGKREVTEAEIFDAIEVTTRGARELEVRQ